MLREALAAYGPLFFLDELAEEIDARVEGDRPRHRAEHRPRSLRLGHEVAVEGTHVDLAYEPRAVGRERAPAVTFDDQRDETERRFAKRARGGGARGCGGARAAAGTAGGWRMPREAVGERVGGGAERAEGGGRERVLVREELAVVEDLRHVEDAHQRHEDGRS